MCSLVIQFYPNELFIRKIMGVRVSTFYGCFRNISLLLVFFMFFEISLSAQSSREYKGETINVTDSTNKKQGKWIFFGEDMKNESGYQPDQLVEEGTYVNNKKDGLWIKYFPNGKPETEINYSNNRPNGEYKVYYENGQLQEHGVWKNNRNIGNFKRFHENGEPQQEFVFNTTGKRDGIQKYYHENGQLMIEGEIREGKEAGEFKEYYANGDIKAIRVYDEAGVLNPEKTQLEIAPKNKLVEIKETPSVPDKVAVVEKGAVQNEAVAKVVPFNGNGDHTLYNKNRQISQKGTFKNYKLIEGMYYKYDDNGILINIERYKNGKYVGDVPIEEESAGSNH